MSCVPLCHSLPYFSEAGALTEAGVDLCPASPRDPPVSDPTAQELQACIAMPGFSSGLWDPDSGPNAYEARTPMGHLSSPSSVKSCQIYRFMVHHPRHTFATDADLFNQERVVQGIKLSLILIFRK